MFICQQSHLKTSQADHHCSGNLMLDFEEENMSKITLFDKFYKEEMETEVPLLTGSFSNNEK